LLNAPSQTGHEYLVILASMIDVAPVIGDKNACVFALGNVYQVETPYDMSFLPSHKPHVFIVIYDYLLGTLTLINHDNFFKI